MSLLQCIFPFLAPGVDAGQAQQLSLEGYLDYTIAGASSAVKQSANLLPVFQSKIQGKDSAKRLVQERVLARLSTRKFWNQSEMIPLLQWQQCLLDVCSGSTPVVVQPGPLHAPSASVGGRNKPVEVYFFPGAGSFEAFIGHIKSTRKSMDLCIYTLTDDDVYHAIMNLKRNGVQIRIISDDEQAQSRGSDILRLKEAGIPVLLDNRPSYMHHKFAVIDGQKVINGSFNWTKNARLNNNENVVVMHESSIVDAFQSEFNRIWRDFGGK